jgi:two-component system response regulator ArlR
MKILLIEDNKKISDNIRRYLELEWFLVDVSFDGENWLKKALNWDFDLILLDLMIPKIDWISLCVNFRKKSDVPIIMITAKSEIDDKLEWFDSGADDYLTKPFDLDELFVRIKAVLKRFNKFDIFEYKDVKVMFENKKVLKNWVEINLTIKEFILMEVLIKNYGISVSRTDIIDYIWWWDSLFEWDNKLDVYISNIRKKLWKDFIKTIKWFGYIIEK